MKRTHLLLALAIIFSLVALPVLAQDVKEPQITGSATVGAQAGSGIHDSSKLQQYETIPTGVTLFDVNFGWKNASNYFMKLDGTKLGLDDQFAAFQGGKKGAWNLHLSLDQNPRWFSNVAETLYNQSGPGVFTLSDGMRTALQRIWSPAKTDPAAPANSNDNRFWSVRDYMNGAQPVDLRYVRKTGLVGLDYTALENWTFKVSYQRETRNGSQPLAFTAGPGIDEVANPINYTTQDTRAEVEYAKNRLFINGMFTYSLFNNDVPYTTVDNPVRLNNTDFFWTSSAVNNTSANATARLWNAPDNKAISFDVTGGYQLPNHHKVTLTASRMAMRVDYALIAQATNPNLNLATTSADYGKFTLTPEYASVNPRLNQTLLMANFSGDPHPKFGYSMFYRSFDVKDRTPSAYTFHSTVNSDGGASYSATGITSSEDARGYGTGQVKVEGHFTPVRGLRIGLNAGHLKSTYEDRSFLDVGDNTVGVTLDANRGWVSFHGGYTSLRRNPGAADPDEAAEGTTGGPLDINAEMKDVAKQDGKLYNAALTLTPVDKAALTFSVQGINSDFPDTSIGLKKSTMTNYGIDVVYAFTDKFSANAGYIYETYHLDSNFWYGANGTVSNPVATNVVDQYFNNIVDKVDTYRAGFRWSVIPKHVDVGSDYDYSKGRSDSGFTITPGGVAGGDLLFPTNTTTVNFTQFQYLNYPQVFNATTIWKTWFNYHVREDVTLGVSYWRQKFDQADWAYDGLAPYMLPGASLYATTPGAVSTLYPQLDPSANRALFLGATVPNYNANIVRVSIGYRF
jgi:MtrB/PioB family decaheme-associated outer membrane protein